MSRKQKVKQIVWDEIVKECRNAGLNFSLEIEDVIFSEDGASRAVILKRTDGIFEIEYERLYPFEEDELCYGELHGFWHPVTSGKTIVDTAEHARKIINENPWQS